MNTYKLIDTFVAKVRAATVPIRPQENAWIFQRLEERLPKRLPQSLEHLLSRYSFPKSDFCGVTLFGWSPGLEPNEYFDAATKLKNSLSELLLPAGYFQIGRPDTGSFDAVCLDMRMNAQNREYPTVLADHEDILYNNRVKISRALWPSFRDLLLTAVESTDAEIYWEEPLT